VFQAYIEMMNDDIRAAFAVANPFHFRHIMHLKSAAQFDDVGPCVVMATPSMLQVGSCMWAAEWHFEPPCTPGGGLQIPFA
jgi:Cft2 family RNA processing exonuclease